MPKVFDCFPFFNEMDLLDLRLHELDSVVDRFVICESREMHGSALQKEPVLRANWDLVKPFEHKLTYILLDRLQPEYTDAASGWQRENFQRNAIMPHLYSMASPDDIVILSDCDEIPKQYAVREAIHTVNNGMCRLALDFYYYNVNRVLGTWTRSTVGTLRQYQQEGGLQSVRDKTLIFETLPHLRPKTFRQREYTLIPNAGWHFSYFGDLQRIRMKAANFAHSTDDFCREFIARDEAQVAADIASGRDLFRRDWLPPLQYRATDDPRLPEYLRSNMHKYGRYTEEGFRQQHAALLGGTNA